MEPPVHSTEYSLLSDGEATVDGGVQRPPEILPRPPEAPPCFSFFGCMTFFLIYFMHMAAEEFDRSFYQHKEIAPLACVVPMATVALMCHAALLILVILLGRFYWRVRNVGLDLDAEEELQLMIASWRSGSSKVLCLAAAVLILASGPCFCVAKHACIFLTTGFMFLYYGVCLFLNQLSIVGKFCRFIGVYALVLATLLFCTEGLLGSQKLLSHPYKDQGGKASICERRTPAPVSCAMPLDLMSTSTLWWAGLPLFADLIPRQRAWLTRYRRKVDVGLLGAALVLLLLLRDPCQVDSIVAYRNAVFSGLLIVEMILIRQVCSKWDPWRGPLEHLWSPASPPFNPQACPICLQDFPLSQGEQNGSQTSVVRTRCNHDFHFECLEEWAVQTSRENFCPLCRTPLG